MVTGTHNWLREKHGEEAERVGFPELFFDLVFVFSIIQLSHALAAHFTPLGLAESLMLILAIWWVWIFTTWVTNWLDPEKLPVRIMLFVLMFAGLLLSASIPEAFGEKALVFALVYVAMQVGRSVFAVIAFRGVDDTNTVNFIRISVWLVVSGIFWIAGALAGHEWQLWLWLLALAVEYAGPAAGFFVPGLGRSTSEQWDVIGAHMAERCALFVIICLGETVLVSGRTFAELHVTGDTLSSLGLCFSTSVAMWWIYFHFGQTRAAKRIEHTADPGAIARMTFTYAHIPVVGGIILGAVGQEFILTHPHDIGSWQTGLAILGGPLAFLLGNLWVKGSINARPPLSHLVGLAGFVAAAFLVPYSNLFVIGLMALGLLVLVAVWEFISLGAMRPQAKSET